MTEPEILTNALECLLFAAKEPVSIARLAEALTIEATELPRLLDELQQRREDSGLQVVHLAGGYCLSTRVEYGEVVARFLQPDPERLSIQALETLAIVAYRQPITRPEIDEVRGVNSSGSVMRLIEKDLVRIAGRKEAPGRPFLLETTPHFLSMFGLKDLEDLPDIGELRRTMEQQGVLITDEEPAEGVGEDDEPDAGDPATGDEGAGDGSESGSSIVSEDEAAEQ